MYILYHFPYSQHARRVVSLLEAAGLPYELRHVDMGQGEHLSAAYLAINPNHQVPTLLDGDLTVHESNAILRYLCHKHDLTDWYPADAKHRARVEQWLDWNQAKKSCASWVRSLRRDLPPRISSPGRRRPSRTCRSLPTYSSSALRKPFRPAPALPPGINASARWRRSENPCRRLDR
jgi:glutathione S-transferase